MRCVRGSLLLIVLIFIAALYLTAGIMFVVNQQYLSNVGLLQEDMMRHQALMKETQRLMDDTFQSDVVLMDWDNCDITAHPDYLLNSDTGVYYQYAKLQEDCGYNAWAYRIWLMMRDNQNDRLVVDLLVAKNDWQNELNGIQFFKENDWILRIDQDDWHQKILLKNSADLIELKFIKIREVEGGYEFVLIFDSGNGLQSMGIVEHFFVLKDSVLDLNSFAEIQWQVLKDRDQEKIMLLDAQAGASKNWQMMLTGLTIKNFQIYNEVIFLDVADLERQKRGLFGIYLNGSSFLTKDQLGVFVENNKDKVDLISCLYKQPFVVSQFWWVGCKSNKVVRYHFS